MELSRQQQDRRTKLRQLFNGPVAVRLLTENASAPVFSVSLPEIAQRFESLHCETDTHELSAALDGGLESGWALDASTGRVTFTQPAIQEPSHASVAGPGCSAKEMAAALTDADKLRLRWNNDANLRQRYPSLTQFQEAAKLGLE